MPDKTYRIFLASSFELKEDREQFEIFINRQNNILQKKNVFLKLVLWEDLGDEVSLTHKQDDYNESLKTCDIFIVLYWTKMGKYTNIEFDMALAEFRSTKKQPKIFVYEKTVPANNAVPAADKKSLEAFQQKLNDTGHFPTQYDNYHHFENQFKKSLEGLFDSGYLQYGEMAECLFTDGNSVPVNFMGRDEELKTIREKLEAGGSLMLINAEGGIGKTSLAAKYWDESLYSYKYNAWLFCENGIVPAIKKLAPKLKVDLNGLNEEQQLATMKNVLLSISNDFLLVLDNANEPKDIEDFKNAFRGFHWHVLITSRCSGMLEEMQEIHIEHLPPAMAKELFLVNYSEETNEFDALLDRVLEAVNYHTLLVEIFSKNMRHLKAFGETLADFLKQLETNGLLLEQRSFKIITDYTANVHKEAGNTDAIVSILYDFSKLQETERYYMVNLALIPTVNYELIFLIDLFLPEDKFAFGEVLRNLAEKGWLSNEENGYRMSPIIQKLLLHKYDGRLQQDCEVLINNLNERLANDSQNLVNLNYQEAAQFAQLIPTITKHLQRWPSDGVGWLNFNSHVYNIAIGDLPEARTGAENFNIINESLNNKRNLVVSYEKLGEIYFTLGDIQTATDFFQKGNVLADELYRRKPSNIDIKNNLAISYQNLGRISVILGDLGKALDYYITSNELAKQLFKRDPTNENFKNGLALTYQFLGNISNSNGDIAKALDFYKKYHEMEEQLHMNYPENVKFKHNFALSCYKLGKTYIPLSNFLKALHFLTQFNELQKELYEDYPDNVSFKTDFEISLNYLGNLFSSQGNLEKAIDFYSEYYELAKETHGQEPHNITFKNNLAVSCYKLGISYEQKKEKKNAKKFYHQALDLYEQLVVLAPQMASYWTNLNVIKRKLSEL